MILLKGNDLMYRMVQHHWSNIWLTSEVFRIYLSGGIDVLIKIIPCFLIIFCRYQTVANGTLRINSVQEGDEGSYQCVVRNDGDSAQATGSLLLGGNAILYHYLDLIEISRLFNNIMFL